MSASTRPTTSQITHNNEILKDYLEKEASYNSTSDIRRFGGKCDGVTDDKTAVLAAISATGSAHIVGNCALSRFDWPQGATLTGSANIKYLRKPTIPCKLDSGQVNHSKMKCAYVFGIFDICEMLQIKTAGFNTIIHYGYSFTDGGSFEKVCNAAEAVGINVIINSPNDVPPASDILLGSRDCVVGYYIFDEPQHNSINVSAQNLRVDNWRSATKKLLCIADNGIFGFENNTLSTKYDIIFADIYHIGAESDDNNKLFSVMGWAELSYKAGNAKLIPAVGLFLGDSQTNKTKQIKMSSHVFKFGDGDMAVFAWDSHASDQGQVDMELDTDFYNQAVSLNSIYYQEPYNLSYLPFGSMGLSYLISGLNYRYTTVDVSPFRVIQSPSAVDERHQVFGDIGLSFRNSGGLAAFELPNYGYIATTLHWRDHAAGGGCNISLIETIDDFFTSSTLDSRTLSHNTGFTVGVPSSEKGHAIGIQCTPTGSQSQYFFKFLSGVIVSCSCKDFTLS